ncbi:MAG: DNA gyrase subunit A [Kiritimatiellia bacterium]|jgi:DNA gyrase subunit A|nr:DNA gyrase subunit A [Kiritimatiellia bacterium]MDP6847961.1 DNA gyrase subunit A [Kiritimatiellia bacterium]
MEPDIPKDRTFNINIEEEMSSSYIDYSMSVIVGRALPDARDGLKPVHRRVLFAMKELSNFHNRPFKKSARVVGDVIGKYHPHGDTAVYDTIVRMAQNWSMRYLLVDGQGNFGSREGDSAAAMRYTEVRMDRLAEELLADIDKDTVDFGPNYDESLEQPLVLPCKIPNLLVNGSTGIAVGMATNIPPHNINEVIDGVIHAIDNPDATVSDLMTYIKGPDFPTYGIVCGMAPIHSMYANGRGAIRLRGRAHFEELKQGRERIIITELPYLVNAAKLVADIAGLVQNKVVEGISDLRNESNLKEPVRIVVELKKGVIPDVILNNLYKHTQLQTTFGANMVAIVDGKPKTLNLKEFVDCFVNHRFEVVTRRTKFELRKAEARAHILEGLKIALDNLSEVVKTIRSASNRDDAREKLISRFGLTDIQAKAILEMRLYQLTGLERDKIEEEYRQVQERIAYLRELLDDERKLYDLIKEELQEIRAKYGDERRTEITTAQDDVNIEDLIADEPCIITISHSGYIKRVPHDTYRAQRRGGKGVAGMATKEEDFVKMVFAAETHDSMLFFTSGGRVYIEKVYQIPEAGRVSRGKAIVNMLNLREDEKIAAMIRTRELPDDKHMVMATERGVVKKTKMSSFRNVRRDGIIAINIDEGDQLIQVKVTDGEDEIMLATEKGMSIRFTEKQLRDQGRATRGVRGIRLRENDKVKSLEIVDTSSTFLVCTENGYGKRTSFDEFRLTNRGGVGIIAIKTSERNGLVVGAEAVMQDDALVLITSNGKMIKMAVDDISVIGRATQGVRLINLDEGDRLVSASGVAPDEDEDIEEGEETDATENALPEQDFSAPETAEPGGDESQPE